MAANPQSQCGFVKVLPPEVRNAVYLELWRTTGLRQHILWHSDDVDQHFCRWSCTTTYEVQDGLQKDIEKLRSELGVPFGTDIWRAQSEKAVSYCRRLQSPWMNHWHCGERAESDYSTLEAVLGPTTSGNECWKRDRKNGKHPGLGPRSAYIPMLLSCRLISAECLQSIFESTTFIFTDLNALQMFFGYCAHHPSMTKPSTPPPALFRHARSIELSLSPDFPALLLCANIDLPELPRRHEVWDFHWLRLDRFQNLQRIDMWIAARSLVGRMDENDGFVGIKQFNADALREVLAPFERVGCVTLSTPLPASLGPREGDGDVEDVAPPGVRLYKRGAGDRFHPFLNFIQPRGTFDGLIHTSSAEEVRLALNGGHFALMEEV